MTNEFNEKLSNMTLEDYHDLILNVRNEETNINSTQDYIDYAEKVPRTKEALTKAVNEGLIDLNDAYVNLVYDIDYNFNDYGELRLIEANSDNDWHNLIDLTLFKDALFENEQEESDREIKPFGTINNSMAIKINNTDIELPLGNEKLTVYLGNPTNLVLKKIIKDDLNSTKLLHITGPANLSVFANDSSANDNQTWQQQKMAMFNSIKVLSLKEGGCNILKIEDKLVIEFDDHSKYDGIDDLI